MDTHRMRFFCTIFMIAMICTTFCSVEGAYAGTGNPLSAISRYTAQSDLKTALLSKYQNNYSVVELLLKSGMRDFDILCRLPDNDISNGVLQNLTKRYYPHFSTILLLYNSNMKSYKNLNE